jgi:UDP-2,3-diacylglucosamine hydrolase
MHTLFISDLHLSEQRPEKLSLFETLLSAVAGRIEALYILGDLFEVSVGDDDNAPPQPAVTRALRAFTDSGTPLKVMHGNRDFFFGETFAHATGAQLLADPHPMNLHGTATLLMHGDLLWQQRFLALPLWMRQTIGRYARWRSRHASRRKPGYIMDVTQASVEQSMRQHRVELMIHGHTHRPAVHEFNLDGRPVRRIVLGDWYEQETLLLCSAAGQELMSTAMCLQRLGQRPPHPA